MAVVGPLGIAPRQQQAVRRHDAIDVLVVDRRQPFGALLSIEDRRDAAVVSWPLRGDLANAGQQIRILGLRVRPTSLGAAGQVVVHRRAPDPERAGDG